MPRGAQVAAQADGLHKARNGERDHTGEPEPEADEQQHLQGIDAVACGHIGRGGGQRGVDHGVERTHTAVDGRLRRIDDVRRDGIRTHAHQTERALKRERQRKPQKRHRPEGIGHPTGCGAQEHAQEQHNKDDVAARERHIQQF